MVGLESGLSTQWRIQGRVRPTLFSDKTEARRAKKKFLETPPPHYLRVWMTGAPPPYPRALDLAMQLVCESVETVFRWSSFNSSQVKSSQFLFELTQNIN